MDRFVKKPMQLSEILDGTFQFYRQHIVKLLFISMLCFGPVILIENALLLLGTDLNWLPSYESWDLVSSSSAFLEQDESINEIGLAIFIFLMLPLLFVTVIPYAFSVVLHFMESIKHKEDMTLKQLMLKPLSRFWPMVGGSVLFSLIVIGSYIVVAILFMIVLIIFALGLGLTMGLFEGLLETQGDGIAFVIILVVIYIIIVGLVWIPPLFTFVRFGFFLPFVALKGNSIGLGKSWQATKGNFWRIFGIFLVMGLIYSIISISTFAPISIFLANSVVGLILEILVYIVLSPLILIAYALIYNDLQVRSEGADIHQAIFQLKSKSQEGLV
jgi:hypothetical protein